jgi:hypothetical protein
MLVLNSLNLQPRKLKILLEVFFFQNDSYFINFDIALKFLIEIIVNGHKFWISSIQITHIKISIGFRPITWKTDQIMSNLNYYCLAFALKTNELLLFVVSKRLTFNCFFA